MVHEDFSCARVMFELFVFSSRRDRRDDRIRRVRDHADRARIVGGHEDLTSCRVVGNSFRIARKAWHRDVGHHRVRGIRNDADGVRELVRDEDLSLRRVVRDAVRTVPHRIRCNTGLVRTENPPTPNELKFVTDPSPLSASEARPRGLLPSGMVAPTAVVTSEISLTVLDPWFATNSSPFPASYAAP